jgi:septin family protein
MKQCLVPIMARGKDADHVPAKRTFFNVLVMGGCQSGKTSFLDSFIGCSEKRADSSQSKDSAVKVVREKDPKNKDQVTVKFMQLTEISEESVLSGQFTAN